MFGFAGAKITDGRTDHDGRRTRGAARLGLIRPQIPSASTDHTVHVGRE